MVVKRSHVTVPRDTFDGEADGPGESVEPLVLSEGALSANHARYLVEQAIEGTAFAAEDLGRVEVLFDHRRAYNQAMLVRDGLLRDAVRQRSDPQLSGNKTASLLDVVHVRRPTDAVFMVTPSERR